jgi:hypothetical protein
LFESGKLDISLYWIWVEIILGQTQKNSRIPALKRPGKEAQSLHRPVGDRIAKVPLGMGVTSLMVVSSCSLWKNDDLSPFILVISPIHMDISTVNPEADFMYGFGLGLGPISGGTSITLYNDHE